MPIQSNRVKALTTYNQAADDPPLDQVGEEILRLRRSRGMSITDLAKNIGRSVGFVSQIERGMSKPSVKDLYAISISLRVQIGWFLLDKEPADARERGVIVRAGNRRGHEHAGINTEALSPYLVDELEKMQSQVTHSPRFEDRVATTKK